MTPGVSLDVQPLAVAEAFGIAADEANDGGGDFQGPDSFGLLGTGVNSDYTISTGSIDLDQPEDLLLYIGANESFDVILDALLHVAVIAENGFGPTLPFPSVARGSVTVTYTYVPAPSAAVALVSLAVPLRGRRPGWQVEHMR